MRAPVVFRAWTAQLLLARSPSAESLDVAVASMLISSGVMTLLSLLMAVD